MLFTLFVSSELMAQGGGPPMLTTDPGTPGASHWEINMAFGYNISSPSNIKIPSTEIVYGIKNRFQISVQLPLPNIEMNKSHFTTFTQPQAGVKYRMLDEEKNFISLSVYPQVMIPLKKEEKIQFFIPIELEKTFGNFRLGEEVGYFVLHNQNLVFISTIGGFHLKNDLELMGEFYWSKAPNVPKSTTGLINFGFRKQLKKHFTLMSSIGTEVITPKAEDRDKLFGLMGVQILLGE